MNLRMNGKNEGEFAFAQGRRKRGAGGALDPQFLAKQLTLSQPGG